MKMSSSASFGVNYKVIIIMHIQYLTLGPTKLCKSVGREHSWYKVARHNLLEGNLKFIK